MENELMTAEDLAAKGVPVAEPPPATEPPPDAHCPNCNGPGIRKGKVIVCEKCDTSFRFTEEGPKVEKLGPFDKLENRVTALETKNGDRVHFVPEKLPAEPPPEPLPAEPIEDDGI